MNKVMVGVALLVTTSLVACAPGQMPTRNLTDVTTVAAVGQVSGGVAQGSLAGADDMISADFKVRNLAVLVPDTLLVSEADVYIPRADIVWHGDPAGDRHQQVRTLFIDSLRASTTDMQGSHLIDVTVEVTRFHALSEKTRATFGGDFNMIYYLTVTDATTGSVIKGPRLVEIDEPASGGRKALREEAAGITQKIVVEAALRRSFARELSHLQMPPSNLDAVSRNDFSPSDLTLAQ